MIKQSIIVVSISAMLLTPLNANASAPWTITAPYGSIDNVHHVSHKGVDFAVRIGTPIHSLTDGIVEVIKDAGDVSFGKNVRIRTPDGRLIIYGHLSKFMVKEGDRIHFGQVIALSGNTGDSTGPHLHFQVNIKGKATDPNPTIWTATLKKALLKAGNGIEYQDRD